MKIVDTEEDVITIEGKNYQLDSIKTGIFYGGVQITLRRVFEIPLLKIAVASNESLVYLKHYKDLDNGGNPIANNKFYPNWYLASKEIENVYERVSIIRSSQLVKAASQLPKYLDNQIKK